MESGREQHTLNDLLRILTTDARTALCRGLLSGGLQSLLKARLASRGLRELVDGEVEELHVRLHRIGATGLAELGRDERWLERWPRCSSLTLHVDEGWEACLAIPFASASASACQRIRQLRVIRAAEDDGTYFMSGGNLLALLLRLRGVQTLELDLALPHDEADTGVDEALTASALACLPHLTSLTLGTVGLVECVPPAVAQRLTHLTIRGDLDEGRFDVFVGTLLPGLTAATSIRVDCAGVDNLPLSAAELRTLLDGLSPSVQLLTMGPVGLSRDMHIVANLEVDCRLTNGVLTSVDIRTLGGYLEELPNHGQLSAFLATALLPCNKLGPRLGRLGLRLCLEAKHPPNPDPAAELLARCDTVELEAVRWCGASRIPALEEIWQRIAPPRQLHWSAGVTGTLHISRADAGRPGGAGGGSQRGGDGFDRERSNGRLPLPLMTEDLPRRAVERMAAAPGPGRTVLLRSPSLQAALEANPEGVCKWFGARARQGVATLAAAGRLSGGLRPHANFLPLPCAGACLLECLRDLPEELASTVARDVEAWVLRAHTGGGGGRAAAEPWLQGMEVLTTALDLNGAAMQELQALWDGAGPLLANDGSPLTPLERLVWLLGSGYGLFGLPDGTRVTRAQ
ncbi:hypothetical protein HYH03_010097 [Edaphochlamys debaryana]|uniref:Uncharacterized protein n=1 Tax=Edaphochlamys debaryana TaxID=47281 RepID=A0A835XWK3_9CHLO|nr:hypothetical protein HYH03_010097 [Edaphochlamys debaryana]|eukprot:KAG2491521.1 hypothetical protein HYH03_010097 [Edaphochlamys debaryana]